MVLSSLMELEGEALVDGVVLVAEGELETDADDETPGGEPVSYTMPLLVAAWFVAEVVEEACRPYRVGGGDDILSSDRLAPAWLLNVTSAFSELQLKSLPENRPRIVSDSSGTLKLLAPLSNLGIASPTVASLADPTLIDVHPALPSVPQDWPVYPFTQRHWQVPELVRTLVPPFWQVNCSRHELSAFAVVFMVSAPLSSSLLGR